MIKKLFLVILLFPTLNLWSQNPDIDILKNINLNRDKHLDNTFRAFTNSAGPIAYGVPILLIGISLARKDSLTFQKSLYIGASVVSSAIVSNILKYAVNRPRPFVTYPFLEKVTSGGSPSFPSGHTADAFSIATSLSIAYPKWYIIIPAYGWAGAVAYSRMDLGVHYPSDVLAGAIIGAGSAYLCYKGQQWLAKKRKK
ncbi:MAG: phosphatase PAP2 family protein [Ignavibacteria bacterium]|nr:phosphatase PAP2 family protein [Ignavibacteria bacterium]